MTVNRVTAPTRDNGNNSTTHKLTQVVSEQKLSAHLNAFQSIAEANDGNRASGTSGYQASVDYVVQKRAPPATPRRSRSSPSRSSRSSPPPRTAAA